MSRITIPKVISAVNTEHPDALDMPDNEFKRLFDECARNRFKITDPEQKWPFWSVERARKKIKAQVQGGIKEKSRKRFFDLLDQYSQNIKSAALMPEVFIRSKSEMEEYWKEISKKQDNQLAEIQKAIKNAELLNHAVSEGQLVVPENMSHPADITEDLHNYLEELSKAIQETRENQNTIRQITIATEEHVRPSAFVYIVALLDSCIADTLRFLFTLNPQQMQAKMNVQTRQENTDRKRLDYKTIIEKGSYQALIAHIVEREVGLITRENIELQLSVLERCGIDISNVDRLSATEIAATRNIYVHNAGKINTDYLKATADYWHKRRIPFKEGQIRLLDENYYGNTIGLVLAVLESIKSSITARDKP